MNFSYTAIMMAFIHALSSLFVKLENSNLKRILICIEDSLYLLVPLVFLYTKVSRKSILYLSFSHFFLKMFICLKVRPVVM